MNATTDDTDIYAKVNPARVFLCTPSHDGNVVTGYAGGLLSCTGLFGGVAFLNGCSHVALARNRQAHAFLSQASFSNDRFDWLLSIDADIEFTRRDLELLYEGDSMLRVAEYSKKDLTSKTPAQFGLGFALIHKHVFKRIREADLPSAPGQPLINDFTWGGDFYNDYYPSGAVGHGQWVGEDHGFFTLAQLAGITPRVETRTSLVHWGRHGYHYVAQKTDFFPELREA